MADHLAAPTHPLDAVDVALAALLAKKFTAATTKAWAQAVTAWAHTIELTPPAPLPSPPVPSPVKPLPVAWADRWQLDQGKTGHCVGFGWAQRFNTLESADPDAAQFTGYTDADAHAIYYECKIIDGEPGQEDGSQVRSGAIAMQKRGKLKNYVFATSTDEITAWVRTKGPVVVGTDFYTGMKTPDSRGLVRPTGMIEGGHCYVIDGYDPTPADGEEYIWQNSWGSWGVNGYARIKVTDFAWLLAAQGDACAALEH